MSNVIVRIVQPQLPFRVESPCGGQEDQRGASAGQTGWVEDVDRAFAFAALAPSPLKSDVGEVDARISSDRRHQKGC